MVEGRQEKIERLNCGKDEVRGRGERGGRSCGVVFLTYMSEKVLILCDMHGSLFIYFSLLLTLHTYAHKKFVIL